MSDSSRHDPFADREAAKYDNPIPSREFIIDLLEQSIGPLTYRELCRELQLNSEDQQEGLRRRLRAMEHDGQVVRNRRDAYGTLGKMNLIKGRVSGHPEGFGFVIPDEGEEDLFLNARQMRRVLDGDRVLVRIAGWDRRGRPEGSIVEVIERGNTRLVGRYFTENGVRFVRPENPRIAQDIVVADAGNTKVKNGEVVIVEITAQPGRNNLPAGKIVELLGEHLAPGMEIEVAIRNHGIPHRWPEAVEKSLARIKDTVAAKDKKHRRDLRHLPLVTIDGEDARDFDDAVYCEPKSGGGWRLYVAIADVSHYVQVGSPLDAEAYQRATSVYFPQQVVPMLPEKLSNGLCSLNPGVDRLAMVCEMSLDKRGVTTGFQFYEAVIHSHARLTYTQVAAALAQKGDKNSDVRKQFHKVIGHIDNLYGLYRQLCNNRQVRGALDFESEETRILFDAERKIQQIIPVERNDAHKLIEECMLNANVCAATLLKKSKLPVLYRVHEPPKQEKLDNLREFLSELGLGLPGGDEPGPKDFLKVLNQINGREDAHVIQTVVLRSMNQAVYQPDNLGHFGLNYEGYTHFTSPIRRYPDLLAHRAIRHLLRSKCRVPHLRRMPGAALMDKKAVYPYDEQWIDAAGEQCSMAERRADDATRDVVSWLKCEYMQDRVGDEFEGVITAVTGFGFFVQLKAIFVEGLVHITGLPKDYYLHEPAHHRLMGERTRKVFRLGDKVRVVVSRVQLDERKIDFDLIESGPRKRSRDSATAVSSRARGMAGAYQQQGTRAGTKAKAGVTTRKARGAKGGTTKAKTGKTKKGKTGKKKAGKLKAEKSKTARNKSAVKTTVKSAKEPLNKCK